MVLKATYTSMDPMTEATKMTVWYRACNHSLRFTTTVNRWNVAAPKHLRANIFLINTTQKYLRRKIFLIKTTNSKRLQLWARRNRGGKVPL